MTMKPIARAEIILRADTFGEYCHSDYDLYIADIVLRVLSHFARKRLILAHYFDGHYLSRDDSDFLDNVKEDIDKFQLSLHSSEARKRVLLLPPVNSYQRLLIHRLVDEYPLLSSFSVGVDPNRQTAICHRAIHKRKMCDAADIRGVSEESPSTARSSKAETATKDPVPRRKTRKPEMEIYVPRGRRILDANKTSSGVLSQTSRVTAESKTQRAPKSTTRCSKQSGRADVPEDTRAKPDGRNDTGSLPERGVMDRLKQGEDIKPTRKANNGFVAGRSRLDARREVRQNKDLCRNNATAEKSDVVKRGISNERLGLNEEIIDHGQFIDVSYVTGVRDIDGHGGGFVDGCRQDTVELRLKWSGDAPCANLRSQRGKVLEPENWCRDKNRVDRYDAKTLRVLQESPKCRSSEASRNDAGDATLGESQARKNTCSSEDLEIAKTDGDSKLRKGEVRKSHVAGDSKSYRGGVNLPKDICQNNLKLLNDYWAMHSRNIGHGYRNDRHHQNRSSMSQQSGSEQSRQDCQSENVRDRMDNDNLKKNNDRLNELENERDKCDMQTCELKENVLGSETPLSESILDRSASIMCKSAVSVRDKYDSVSLLADAKGVSGYEDGAISETGLDKVVISETGFERGRILETGSDKGTISDTGYYRGSISETGFDKGTISDTGYYRGSISETGSDKEAISEIGSHKRAMSETGSDKEAISYTESNKGLISETSPDRVAICKNGCDLVAVSESKPDIVAISDIASLTTRNDQISSDIGAVSLSKLSAPSLTEGAVSTSDQIRAWQTWVPAKDMVSSFTPSRSQSPCSSSSDGSGPMVKKPPVRRIRSAKNGSPVSVSTSDSRIVRRTVSDSVVATSEIRDHTTTPSTHDDVRDNIQKSIVRDDEILPETPEIVAFDASQDGVPFIESSRPMSYHNASNRPGNFGFTDHNGGNGYELLGAVNKRISSNCEWQLDSHEHRIRVFDCSNQGSSNSSDCSGRFVPDIPPYNPNQTFSGVIQDSTYSNMHHNSPRCVVIQDENRSENGIFEKGNKSVETCNRQLPCTMLDATETPINSNSTWSSSDDIGIYLKGSGYPVAPTLSDSNLSTVNFDPTQAAGGDSRVSISELLPFVSGREFSVTETRTLSELDPAIICHSPSRSPINRSVTNVHAAASIASRDSEVITREKDRGNDTLANEISDGCNSFDETRDYQPLSEGNNSSCDARSTSTESFELFGNTKNQADGSVQVQPSSDCGLDSSAQPLQSPYAAYKGDASEFCYNLGKLDIEVDATVTRLGDLESQKIQDDVDSADMDVSQTSRNSIDMAENMASKVLNSTDETEGSCYAATEPALTLNSDDKSNDVGDSTEKTDQSSDEDSWFNQFDDNGDCLDPLKLKELEEAVGKVSVVRPPNQRYKMPSTKVDVDTDDFSHVLEIYGFPSELVTTDLMQALFQFQARGLTIRWVDDTHALAIFSSHVVASEALGMVYSNLKLRPLSDATAQSRSKAHFVVDSTVQPYKERPQTSAVTAHRMVAGALGVAPKISREQRDEERRKLQEARDKRRQLKKNQETAWDGSYGKCAMDDV